ncbi:MAG: phage major capsid protein, partial [Mycobacterium sp.]
LLGIAYRSRQHCTWDAAATWAENRFGDSDVAKALNSSITGEGGALIPQDFLADLIELLRANTVVRGSGPMTVGMPMGNLTIPRLAGGSSASYQNELEEIAVNQQRFDDINFVAKKLTCLVPVSNDLIRRSPIGVEEIVRDDLVQGVARREDLAFLRGTGTAITKDPKGLRNLVLAANLITVPPTPIDADLGMPLPGAQLSMIIAGLSAAILALQNGLSRMIRPVWIMTPTSARYIATARDQVGGYYYKDEMSRGMLEGYPYKISQQIPSNLGTSTVGSEIYLADFADVIIADTYNVMVDASDVATYREPANVTGTTMNLRSAFQWDQTLFRVISEHDFNMRHLQSLAILIVSDWTFPGVVGGPGVPWSTQPLNPTWSQAPAIRPATLTGADPAPPLTNPALFEPDMGDQGDPPADPPPTQGPLPHAR